MKFEIAKELGLADKVVAGGWRSLTAKESGRIGGLMTKKEKRAVCGGRTHLMRRKGKFSDRKFLPVTGKLPLNNRQFSL